MIQMGLNDMIWGRLTDKMMVEDGDTISLKNYVHPRVEPEIAFLLKRPLPYPWYGRRSAGRRRRRGAGDGNHRFPLPELQVLARRRVADNASSSSFVVGPWHRPDTDLENLGMVMEFNGRPVQIGSSAAILGQPVRSLVSAARLTSEAGEGSKRAGS